MTEPATTSALALLSLLQAQVSAAQHNLRDVPEQLLQVRQRIDDAAEDPSDRCRYEDIESALHELAAMIGYPNANRPWGVHIRKHFIPEIRKAQELVSKFQLERDEAKAALCRMTEKRDEDSVCLDSLEASIETNARDLADLKGALQVLKAEIRSLRG